MLYKTTHSSSNRTSKLYFLENHLVQEISILYTKFLNCILRVQFSEHIEVINIQCDTNYHLILTLVLLGFLFMLYKAGQKANIVVKPVLLLLFKLSIYMISIIIFPEKVSRFIFTILVSEFRLVSIFFGTIFFLLQIFAKEILLITGLLPEQSKEIFL
jgi:hypothetical protein